MSTERAPGEFGCDRCWPSSAEAADAARRTLRIEAELVDESHFRITIRACPGCSQRFVSLFTEMIDWKGGDDAQYWTLMPVTQAETADLVGGGSLSESALNTLAGGRRSLFHDHPTGKPARTGWGTGLWVGPHD
jgi:hypothetical protein